MNDEELTASTTGSDETETPQLDATQVLRRRADQARAERDESVRQLRESMSDDDVLAEFGIDLGEIEQ